MQITKVLGDPTDNVVIRPNGLIARQRRAYLHTQLSIDMTVPHVDVHSLDVGVP
jgi:hypothetical protein